MGSAKHYWAMMERRLAEGCALMVCRNWPTRRRVRARVMAHCRERLCAWAWSRVHQVPVGPRPAASPAALRQLQAEPSSHWGRFGHVQTAGLGRAPWRKFASVGASYLLLPDGRHLPQWTFEGSAFSEPLVWLRTRWQAAQRRMPRGYQTGFFGPEPAALQLASRGPRLPVVRARQIDQWRLLDVPALACPR